MTAREQDQLLDEILQDETFEGLRQSSLDAGLHAIRQRRRQRLAVKTSVIVMVFVLCLMPFAGRRSPSLGSVSPRLVVSPPVERLTADQLLALFPDRPVALVGKAGEQQLIFLENH
jgi:hypothetical protein